MMQVEISRDEVFRYLGYHGTVPDAETAAQVEAGCAKITEKMVPRWVHRVFSIEHTEQGVLLENNLLLTGNSIKKHLQGCQQAAVFAATLSADIDRLIHIAEAQDMAQALILDTCASAAIEAVCDKAEAEICAAFPEHKFPFRFSPGYGDLPIDLQERILSMLDAQRRIGLYASKNHILTPRKSVTAILGISENDISRGKSGCATCTMRGRCNFQCKEK